LSRFSTLQPTGKKTRRGKRGGPLTKPEKDLIAAVVLDQPREMQAPQISSLAHGLRRSKDAVKAAIEDARGEFLGRAGRYVQIHAETTEAALANGDAKSLEVAARSSQWAIERISVDGMQIVERPTDAPTGARIFIGLSLGGTKDPITTIEIPTPVIENVK
jgi:hypothetical protein